MVNSKLHLWVVYKRQEVFVMCNTPSDIMPLDATASKQVPRLTERVNPAILSSRKHHLSNWDETYETPRLLQTWYGLLHYAYLTCQTGLVIFFSTYLI